MLFFVVFVMVQISELYRKAVSTYVFKRHTLWFTLRRLDLKCDLYCRIGSQTFVFLLLMSSAVPNLLPRSLVLRHLGSGAFVAAGSR